MTCQAYHFQNILKPKCLTKTGISNYGKTAIQQFIKNLIINCLESKKYY